MSNDKTGLSCIHLTLTTDLYLILKNIADRNKVDLTSVIKHAIALEKYYHETAEDPYCQLLIERHGEIYNIEIPYN